jgi:prepilin-type processing-associated H-X9-DG protein
VPTSNDPESGLKTYRFRDVRDGLSKTVMMSERRLGNRNNDRDFANVAFEGFLVDLNDELDGVDNNNDPLRVRNNCQLTASREVAYSGTQYLPDVDIIGGSNRVLEQARPGERWADGRPYFAGFNTVLSPNGPSCAQAEGDFYPGVYTASSRHSNVVHILMGDGSTRRVLDSIDSAVWWAVGTRAGNENAQLIEE